MRAGGERPPGAPPLPASGTAPRPRWGRLALATAAWLVVGFAAYRTLLAVPYLRLLVLTARPLLGLIPGSPSVERLLLERDLPDDPVYGGSFRRHLLGTLVQGGRVDPGEAASLLAPGGGAAGGARRALEEELDRVRGKSLGILVITSDPTRPSPRLRGGAIPFNIVIFLVLFLGGLPGPLRRRLWAALKGWPLLLAFQVAFLLYSAGHVVHGSRGPVAAEELDSAFFEARVREGYVFLVSLVPVLLWLYHRLRLAGPPRSGA